ncbi:MAG: hypothetical protein ACRCWW_14085 [Scandinavium sp.]|uniref:tail fiber/spike domain-containing protein n=1 Tax=Scandinavium sp. TaxID=2830653 RepID=UPI003F30FB09
MTTTPTQLAVPSEKPQDLKFNAGKIDEFVTSDEHEYVDRFGNSHRTIAGINYDANQAILNYGYITKDSFEDGSTLSTANECLRWKSNGEYYRWDGAFPKVVPPGSTPDSTGGIGEGKWVSVGDAALRTELANGQYRSDATAIKYVPGVVIDDTTDNRSAIYAFSGPVYIPKGVQLRCNFQPNDDVTKFVGEGKILTRDPWGNEHVFDVSLATQGSKFTGKQLIAQAHRKQVSCNVGVIGDSITDGEFGWNWSRTDGRWQENPKESSGERNLTSTNYDHNQSGGSGSWFHTFIDWMNSMAGVGYTRSTPIYFGRNCAAAGQQLADGWAYRNFDYGFFQNVAYGNKAPDVLLLSMGFNDDLSIGSMSFDDYLTKYEQFIAKAWGYGCAVILVSMTSVNSNNRTLESAVKRHLVHKYPILDFIDLGEAHDRFSDMNIDNTISEKYVDQDNASAFSMIHPRQKVHEYWGAFAAKECKPESAIFAKPMTTLQNPMSKSGFCIDGSLNVYTPSLAKYSTAKLGVFGTDVLPSVFLSAAGTVRVFYHIWVEEEVIELYQRGWLESGPSRTSFSDSVYVTAQDIRRDRVRYNGVFFGRTGFSGAVEVNYVGGLRAGMNLVQMSIDGSITTGIIPEIVFGKTCSQLAISGSQSQTKRISKQIVSSSSSLTVRDTGFGKIENPRRCLMSGDLAGNYLPTFSNSGVPFDMSLRIFRASLNAGFMFCFNHNSAILLHATTSTSGGSTVPAIRLVILNYNVSTGVFTEGTQLALIATDKYDGWVINFERAYPESSSTITLISPDGNSVTNYNVNANTSFMRGGFPCLAATLGTGTILFDAELSVTLKA